MNSYIDKNKAYCAIFFINILLITVLFSTIKQGINNFFSFNINYSVFLLALIATITIDFLLKSKRIDIKSISLNIIILLFFIILSSSTEAFGVWDGVLYHKPAMYWQYFSHNLIYASLDEIPFWSYFYPKLTWIFSGEITSFIGKFEALTVYSLLLSASLFFYSQYFCEIFNIKKSYTYIFSILLTFNPVAISQVLSTYVDSSLFSLVGLIFLSAIAFARQNDTPSKIIFIISCIIIINIKYSAFLFVGVAFLYLGFFFIKNIKKQIEVFSYFLIFCLIGIGIIGFNPYIKNLIEGKHFFHPVFGDEKIEIMSQNTPELIRDKNRFIKFFYANFSFSKSGLEDPEIKNPFEIRKQEFKNVAFNYDIRIGGFGPLFPLILILFSIYLIFSIFSKNRKDIRIDLFFISLFSILFNPESWWARYSPSTYIIILTPLLVKINNHENGINQSLRKSISYILIIQATIISYYQFRNMQSHNEYARNNFSILSKKEILISQSDENMKNIIHFFPRYKIKPSFYDGNKLVCIREKSIQYSYLQIRYCESEKDLYPSSILINNKYEDIINISQFPDIPYSHKSGGYLSKNIKRGVNFIKIRENNEFSEILNFDTFSGVLINELELHKFLHEDNTENFMIIGWDSLVPDIIPSEQNALINQNIFKFIDTEHFQPLKFRQSFIALLSKNGSIKNIIYGDPEKDLIVLINHTNNNLEKIN